MAVSLGLKTRLIGRRIIYEPKVASTMNTALEAAYGGADDGSVIIAGEQTAARGRLNRVWQTPPGNIALSVILYPQPEYLPFMVMLASLSVVRSVRAVTGLEAGIKWPNDIILGGRKVCGILAESHREKGRGIIAVIGIGINVAMQAQSYDDIALPATGLNAAAGRDISRLEVVRRLLEEMDGLYLSLPGGGGAIFRQWRENLITLGRRVQVTSGAQVLEGAAEDVAPGGALLLRMDNGEVKEIIAGDVSLRDA